MTANIGHELITVIVRTPAFTDPLGIRHAETETTSQHNVVWNDITQSQLAIDKTGGVVQGQLQEGDAKFAVTDDGTTDWNALVRYTARIKRGNTLYQLVAVTTTPRGWITASCSRLRGSIAP